MSELMSLRKRGSVIRPYVSEFGPRIKTSAVKYIARGAAKLPYRWNDEHLSARILNYTSESWLKALMGLARAGMKKRINDRFIKGTINIVQREQRKEFLDNLFKTIEHGFLQLSPNVRKSLVNSLIINNMEIATIRKREFERQYGYSPPVLYVMSPTMACNLTCTGCYAFMYERNKGLENEVIDHVIEQGKEIGIYFVVISGGEPFIRKDDMLRMARKHSDVYFMFYTNGTFIDEELACQFAELGNISPAISVEGFREQTDARRGEGIHKKVVDAMRFLRKQGVFYGLSFTAVRNNHDILIGRVKDTDTGKNFIQYWMDEHGAWYGWVFNYIPTGKDPCLELMPTPEQAYERGKFVRELRHQGYIVSDFWNDGYLSGESVCLAGARNYFHINANGNVEPCVFAHYTVPGNNVKEKSIVEIINCDYFSNMRKRQFDNPLRPCMLIHQPDFLREDYEQFKLQDTDGMPALVCDEEVRRGLDEWSEAYGKLADSEHKRLLKEYERVH